MVNLRPSEKIIPGVLCGANKKAFAISSQHFVAYGCQKYVCVVDCTSFQVVQVLERHAHNVCCVEWSHENVYHDLSTPYQLRLCSADVKGQIVVWDVRKGTFKTEFSDGNYPVLSLKWLGFQDISKDLLLVLHTSTSLVLWNTDTATKLWKANYADCELLDMQFDPFDSSRLLLYGSEVVVLVDDFTVATASTGRRLCVAAATEPPADGRRQGRYELQSLGGAQARRSTSGAPAAVRSSVSTTSVSLSELAASDAPIERLRGGARPGIGRRLSHFLAATAENLKTGAGGAPPPAGAARDRPDTAVMRRSQTLLEQFAEPHAVRTDIVQALFHSYHRNVLVLVLPHELLLFDLLLGITVGFVLIEPTGAAFMQAYSCRQRDILYCLQENGCVTLRARRRRMASPISGEATDDNDYNAVRATVGDALYYDLKCQTDHVRVTRITRAFAFAVDPMLESGPLLLISDGRLFQWKLWAFDTQGNALACGEHTSLAELLPAETEGALLAEGHLIPGVRGAATVVGRTAAATGSSARAVVVRMHFHQFLSSIAPQPVVMRMCPPMTTRNMNYYKSMIAIGTGQGVVQVFDLVTGLLHREFCLFTSAVRGLEWLNLNRLVAISYSQTSGAHQQPPLVRNDILMLDIRTGQTATIRRGRDEEAPVECVRVSYLKQYLVILFKDAVGFELWDMRSRTLIREMQKHCLITALEWSPSTNIKTLRRKLDKESQALPEFMAPDAYTENRLPSHVSAKEHFVFTDVDGRLFHYIVEGSTVEQGSSIAPEVGMSHISSIAWKGDMVVMGDIEGNMNLWDLKARFSRVVPTRRGGIRRVKFAPGHANSIIFVLYNDGLDIWDAKEVVLKSSVRCPRDLRPNIVDCDWCSSDSPVLLTTDHTLRIVDLHCRVPPRQLGDWQQSSGWPLARPVCSPSLLSPPKLALIVRTLLCGGRFGVSLEEPPAGAASDAASGDAASASAKQISLLDGRLQHFWSAMRELAGDCVQQLGAALNTAERCLLCAKLFGDENDQRFWTLVASLNPQLKRPLPASLDMLLPDKDYYRLLIERTAILDARRTTFDHNQIVIDNLIIAGQFERALQVLLETDTASDEFLNDAFRACALGACEEKCSTSQSTIKLVATNLIAAGYLLEGCQLLCGIGKRGDACRYLQAHQQWLRAAQVAKASVGRLGAFERRDMLRRYVDHLNSPGVLQRGDALLWALAAHLPVVALTLLVSSRQPERAALLLRALREFQLVPKTHELRDAPDYVVSEQLVTQIDADYERYLAGLHLAFMPNA